ncbi:MAG: hypothetical protein NUW24_09795 [Anaerolineae bacterium]|jgi:hypothetical protein|nr:hypothetical protein [Anaerolineae bacterium]MDH7474835.1 hypothetical protein [Anaerolineae bacterium]
MKRIILLVILPLLALCLFTNLTLRANGRPIQKTDLIERRIYAYRGWQSIGLTLHPGELLTIKAQGRWLYSPEVGYHGPQGSSVQFPAPLYYPLPNKIGGCLIARIGETGKPFYVGRGVTMEVDTFGPLYLRINDDIVTDNDGYVTIEVTVVPPEED